MAKPRKGYFYETEEQAVIDYINAESQEEKSKIFNEKLYYPFTKMIESIIRRYNLQIPNELFEDTFNDTLSFLLTKINNFDYTKNTKAYSYCGTICKHYLIFKKTQYGKNQQKLVYMDTPSFLDEEITYYTPNPIPPINDIIEKMSKAIDSLINSNFKYKKITPNEIKVGIALKEMLCNWEQILMDNGSNKLNKSSILYFLRENTLLPTKDITIALKKYKQLYFAIKNTLL